MRQTNCAIRLSPRALLAVIAFSCGACVSPPPSSEPAPETAEAAPDSDAVDPPTRVGRINLVEGAVSFRPAAADTWAVAQLNRPVTSGDRLWADSGGRAELELGGRSAVRIGSETEVDVTHLDDDLVQFSVPEGTVELRMKQFRVGGEYEIDLPNAALTPNTDGRYRVNVSPGGDTSHITVWSGSIQVTAAGRSFVVSKGQRAVVVGDSAPSYDVAAASDSDAFDQWASSRDHQEALEQQSSQYLPPDIAGLDELDANGRWATSAVCGAAWYPNGVAAGWAPYHDGNWVWIDPWGWNWVAAESWGWAPFHYGRWELIDGTWGWCPGTYPYGAAYAPALVAFVGGSGWDWQPGGWGWYPLSWGEEYVPVYRVGPFYRRWINGPPIEPFVPHRNRGIPGAVVFVPPMTFARADPVSRTALQVPVAAIQSAPLVGAAPAVAPTPASLAVGIGGDRLGRAPPSAYVTRPVQALRAPPPRPLPFAAERAALATTPGRPLPEASVVTMRTSLGPTGLPARRVFRPAAIPYIPGAVLRNARPGLTPLEGMSAPALPTPGAPRSTLDADYAAERQAMMSRHVTEFAHPSKGESQPAQAQRQESERRDLETRYNTARSSGAAHMSAPRSSGGGGGGGSRSGGGGGGGGGGHSAGGGHH